MSDQIGVTGLAVMGANLARNLARHGHQVVLHNRSQARTDALVEAHGSEGDFVPTGSVADFVQTLQRPRKIIIMVKAGAPTDAVIDEIAPLLEEGDVLMDGGNALFTDTVRRTEALTAQGLHFVGTGISGGEEGALNGPSIMPGGSAEAYELVGPLLESIAAVVDGEPCCTHVGESGAGHFVKMVHNGIEYADMQLIAEAYDLLRQGLGMSPAEIGDVFADWNTGDLSSYLIEITAQVLRHTDAETGAPFVDVVVDEAEQKGTGRWTVQSALDLGVPVSGIAEAVFARALSGHREQRRAAQQVLPGPGTTWDIDDRDAFVESVRQALYASKVVAYAQGFDQITQGADQYGWDIDRAALARIWRGGCIIRADFLDRIAQVFTDEPDVTTLLTNDYFRAAVSAGQEGWRQVVAGAARNGVPVPGFGSALSYYDGLRAERLPASLIQGLRDLFGAHTYQRVDKEGSFHTMWGEDGREVPA
ncbi:NADP-dependent phosphogluconate dehydrogenase [Modestobacter muralis]|uniref:6-phosphogluconate dehydrogenase, decarboxylating n=1 Tax=Modestobacter muralis TaxID=1608614 RepID=A0A6P0H8Q6_9ACTN|nr:NADP-dependent phosphogluconate dehydrogenase [Modestobacter muralis]NEK94298.1 NADP-dependent phosphogluconate dehydrogenase [Modestobacter muralis]NEN51186.1 NADP-dependent phosphogluconate dehydrogenase [Modestobacter muralis]